MPTKRPRVYGVELAGMTLISVLLRQVDDSTLSDKDKQRASRILNEMHMGFSAVGKILDMRDE